MLLPVVLSVLLGELRGGAGAAAVGLQAAGHGHDGLVDGRGLDEDVGAEDGGVRGPDEPREGARPVAPGSDEGGLGLGGQGGDGSAGYRPLLDEVYKT